MISILTTFVDHISTVGGHLLPLAFGESVTKLKPTPKGAGSQQGERRGSQQGERRKRSRDCRPQESAAGLGRRCRGRRSRSRRR